MKYNRSISYLLAILLVVVSCKVQLVSPYDQEIESGIIEFKEELNVFVKKMENAGGTEAGTFDSNKDTYAELETKIDILVDRASLKSTGSCKLPTKVTTRLNTIVQKEIDKLKVETNPNAASETILDSQKTLIDAQLTPSPDGNSYGCSERLLELVKNQLVLLKQLHAVKSCNNNSISCLNKAEANDALNLINISINAVWIVEEAKKGTRE